MKGGLAVILIALAELARRPLRGTVSTLLVPDEEHAGFATRELVKTLRVDAALVLEATGLNIGVAHAGVLTMEIPCATSKHRKEVLWRMLAVQASVSARPPHPQVGRSGLAFAPRDGPLQNVFLRYRLVPGEDDAIPRLAIGSRLADLLDVRDIRWWARGPFGGDPDCPLGAALRTAAAKRDLPVRSIALDGWTDAAVLEAAGIPALVFGPSGGGRHSSHEWLDTAQAEAAADIVSAAALELCG